MKKAKIMLAAITVLAVVGGALAFKAKTFNEAKLFVRTTTLGQNLSYCTIAGLGVTTVENGDSFSISEATIKTTIRTTLDFTECPTTVTYTLAE